MLPKDLLLFLLFRSPPFIKPHQSLQKSADVRATIETSCSDAIPQASIDSSGIPQPNLLRLLLTSPQHNLATFGIPQANLATSDTPAPKLVLQQTTS